MVRLEVEPPSLDTCKDHVSIPIWCDWKLKSQLLFAHPLGRFNSYMVRLEAVFSSRSSLALIPMFQFLYGAIGSYNGRDFFMTITLFQFLYGAIGSYNGRDFFMTITLFQFLYGAIGS